VTFSTTLPALGLDVAAITILVHAIYHRRHWRRDLLGAYVALNLGVFCAVTLLATQEVGED
jgi:threonine/homoserine efflux transporter RhtA